MAYTIVKSDGSVLTTIADGTINTTSTSLGLPGRNYAGYGQAIDTNFVHITENFAATTPPANPLRGQLWYNINASTLLVCPADGQTNPNAWITLAVSSGTSTTTFGAVQVTGNLTANNITAVNSITGDTLTVRLATVTANASISNASMTTANIGSLFTQSINPGVAGTTSVVANGTVTINGGLSGNTLVIQGGVIYTATGIKTDNYYYANGSPFNPTGTYTNGNVFDYLTGSNSVSQFTGNIAPTKVTTTVLAGGGNIQGIWTLASGAKFNATYADLAERYEADAVYSAGTVVEIGGEKEITAVQNDLSDAVFGVISNSYAYLLNSDAGNDTTHPAVALTGRVSVNVTGPVKKGQRLVAAGNGLARGAAKAEYTPFNIIGRALENKSTDDVGVIQAVVRIN
jgi:hypothetical protein